MRLRLPSLLGLCLLLLTTGCPEPDPEPTDGGPDVDAGGDALPDVGDADSGNETCLTVSEPTQTCAGLTTDYAPGTDDMWPACVSDEGTYVRIQESISSIGRVAAFETMAQRLFVGTPSPDDFLQARIVYQEDEGLGSRVERRFDPHFEVPEGTDCREEGVPAMYPERCVGPARLQPTVLAALASGSEGQAPLRNAGEIEGALLWFFYASVAKESFTCTEKPGDCDSSWAYYNGGDSESGLGLARYVRAADAVAHERVNDGLLAIRCWRDLDSGEVALDLDRRDLARAQTDIALLRGLTKIVAERIRSACERGVSARDQAFVDTLLPALRRAFAERGGDMDEFDALSSTPLSGSGPALVTLLESTFNCP